LCIIKKTLVMKKLVFLLAGLLLSMSVSAKTAGLFRYDHNYVDQALATVNAVDNYVSLHAVSLDQLDLDNPMLAGFKAESNLPMASENAALGIPGFWWGLALNWVGIVIVYLMTEDQEETKQALYGCILNTVLWTGCWFLYYYVLYPPRYY